MTGISQQVPKNILNKGGEALGQSAECDNKMANKRRSKYAYGHSESGKVDDSFIAQDLLQSSPIL